MRNEVKEGVLVVYLEGNLLGGQANSELMNLILQNMSAGIKKAVLNLAGINYVDSAGLGMLLSAASKTKNAGGLLVICNLSEQVMKLLRTTKVESIFRIQPDEASAIGSLNSMPG